MGYEKYAYTTKKVDTYAWEFILSSLSITCNPGDKNINQFKPKFLIEVIR